MIGLAPSFRRLAANGLDTRNDELAYLLMLTLPRAHRLAADAVADGELLTN